MSQKSVRSSKSTPAKKQVQTPTLAPSPFMGPVLAPQDNTYVAPTRGPSPKQVGGSTPGAPQKQWWEENADRTTEENRPPEVDAEMVNKAATDLFNAMDGWGTNEDAVLSTLRGKTPAEIAAIRTQFKNHYDQDLDSWIKDEMGGDDLKEVNALMSGDKVAGVLAGLENSVGFWGDDEAKIEELMRGLSADELKELKASPKWAQVQKSMNSALGGDDQEVFDALVQGDKGTASAIRIDDAMDGWGTDEDAIYANLSNLTPEERKAAETAYNKRLEERGESGTFRENLDSELSNADNTRAIASLDNDTATEAAAKIEQTMEGMGTDEAALFKELEGLPESERLATLAAYEKAFGTSLTDRLSGEVGGIDSERALMAADGAQDDTFKLFYGMNGLGTDEELLKSTLEGKSKQEIEAMRERWNKEFQYRYGADFDSAFNSELSGRDNFDVVEIALRGKPETAEEKREVMELQYDYERGSRSTGFGRGLMNFADTIGFSSSASMLDMQNERLQEAIGPDGKIAAPDSAIDDLYGYTKNDVESYREAKDTATEALATGVELTVATVATIATAGSASPWLAAALSSAIGGVAGMGTKALIQGEAYGIEDVGVDALSTVLGASLSSLKSAPQLMSKIDELSSTFGPKFAAMVAENSGNPLARSLYRGGAKGLVLGAGYGAKEGIMDEDALRSGAGDYLGGILGSTVEGMGRGGLAGLTTAGVTQLADSRMPQEGLKGKLVKQIARQTAISTSITALTPGTYEGGAEDIFKRFAGSGAAGIMEGIGYGARDYRAANMKNGGVLDHMAEFLTTGGGSKKLANLALNNFTDPASADADAQSVDVGADVDLDSQGEP